MLEASTRDSPHIKEKAYEKAHAKGDPTNHLKNTVAKGKYFALVGYVVVTIFTNFNSTVL